MTFPFTKNIHYQNQSLSIEGCSIEALALKVNTPFYVYSQARLLDNITACKAAFDAHNIQIHYAVKANCNLHILQLIASQGIGVDLVSGGELYRATKAGVQAEKMVFSGVGKSRSELIQAINMHIGQFNVESAEELALLATLAEDTSDNTSRKLQVALRVNPNVVVNTHKNITTGQKGNKFGIDMDLALTLFEHYANHPSIELVGLAMHIGSQIFEVAPYREAIQKLRLLATKIQEKGGNVSVLDLGGGFGINYGENTPLDFATIAHVIAEETKGFRGKVAVEPGRSLVADIGLLVSRVNYVKESHPTPFLILDAAMNDLMRPALYQASHPIKEVIQNTTSATRSYDIVGPVCESTDIFASKYPLDTNIKAGDLVTFFCAGAYSAVMSNSYNSRDIVPEVFVNGQNATLVRERITQEALLQYEVNAKPL
ncbi:diaminopimelate decarboxylase [Marinomonas algicola]|uniref:diaminopimelate decarboxylase n=1 Tax=Marinomonas algicola TaxID=2773454 RepID=UPI001749BC8A|nr:diaminopimelate decarboxylase [Marinomonas algicola]